MFDHASHILKAAYGIEAMSIMEVPAGCSAAAYRVQGKAGDYFLKIYDKHRPSTKIWVDRITYYMPVVLWLHAQTALQNSMIAPVLTKDGSYQWEDEAEIFLVYPYVDGRTIAEARLEIQQIDDLAGIVAELHLYGDEIPILTTQLRESFDVSFCLALTDHINTRHHADRLAEIIKPHAGAIGQAVQVLRETASSLSQAKLRFVLCHTDIHGWNLMQSEKLILIDWEGLKLAPVEADLFTLTGGFFFDYAREAFMHVYCATHKAYQVNREAMRFYRLKRVLEDIAVFSESIRADQLTEKQADWSCQCLKQVCRQLRGVLFEAPE